MRDFALPFVMVLGLFLSSATADEISILYRPRPSGSVLQYFSSQYEGNVCFTDIPIAERKKFEAWVDPFAVGHVAIKFEDPRDRKTKIVGWTPANAETHEAVDAVLAYFLSGSSLEYKTPVRGAFRDDSAWARGAILDPVHEISLTVSSKQVVIIANEVDRANKVWTGYQVLPNYDSRMQTWSYPKNSFNCLEAVRYLLALASVKVPFEIPKTGLLTPFSQVAAPHVVALHYGDGCAPDVASYEEESLSAY